ncbi:hypothetical protein ACE0DR_16870 [Azotobacter sp. CWF10]
MHEHAGRHRSSADELSPGNASPTRKGRIRAGILTPPSGASHEASTLHRGFLFAGLSSPLLLAEACHVTEQLAVAGTASDVMESCFEHRGMPAGSLDWSCSTDKSPVAGVHKEKRANCPSGYFGKCTAALTQEALANEEATGQYGGGTWPDPLPEDAQIVTYYYRVQDQKQTHTDCENGGGQWSQ